MNLSLIKLVCCEQCDVIHHKLELESKERAYCICCGAELYRPRRSLSSLLAIVVTSFIVFVIANCFPILKIEIQGQFSQVTLLSTVLAMFHADHQIIGILILFTTFITPLLISFLLFYILFFIVFLKRIPPYFTLLLRFFDLLRTWSMLEVFLIGVLVTIVKLIMMVIVVPDIALWAFALLSILMVYMTSVTVDDIWEGVEEVSHD